MYPKPKVARLYHLTDGPSELNDLTNRPTPQEAKQQFLRRLLVLQKEFGDELYLTAAFSNR